MDLVQQLLMHLPEGRSVLALEGPCASGKTTLAEALRRETGCPVIHMDHFFLRPEQRTKERLREPGGNFDRERFLREVAFPLQSGSAFSYRPYLCHTQTFGEPVRIVPDGLCVVEGSYSCHPALWELYSLRIFLSVSPEEQIFRIRKRNGEKAAEKFRDVWIPMENEYFTRYRIAERCDGRIGEEGHEVIWQSF